MQDSRIMTGNGSIVGDKKFVGDSSKHPNFSNNKVLKSWDDWDEDVSRLCKKIESTKALFVYGIPRGGVTLSTMISHRLGIPMVTDAPNHWMLDWHHWKMRQSIDFENTSKTILIVDAICDSGKTLDYLEDSVCNVLGITKDPASWTILKAVVDVDPKVVKKVDYHINIKSPSDWIVYPWEVGSQELLNNGESK